jgi:hypothetical protein
MPIATRSTARGGGSEANSPASSTKDVTSPPPNQTPASTKERVRTTKEAGDRRRARYVDVGDVPAKNNKRKHSEHSDEETGTYPMDTTPSKAHKNKREKLASPTSYNSNKNTTEAIPPRNISKIEFASVEDMASKDFTSILADRGINVRKAEIQGFSNLEVDGSEHQTAVYWKTISGSTPSLAKLPDTATFGNCSVFAIDASTKEKFEERAKRVLSHNMGSETLKRSMALVLHFDHGKLRSAIVGYPLGKDLHYSDSLKAETANKIVTELNRGKGPERWNLELLREGPSRKKKFFGTDGRDYARYESDTLSD